MNYVMTFILFRMPVIIHDHVSTTKIVFEYQIQGFDILVLYIIQILPVEQHSIKSVPAASLTDTSSCLSTAFLWALMVPC